MTSPHSIISAGIIISFSTSILISYFVTTLNKNNNIDNYNNLQNIHSCNLDCNNGSNIFNFYNSLYSTPKIIGSTVDAKYDTHLTTLYKTTQMPEIHGFYDIVSTYVSRLHNNSLIFTINLDDDPNKNTRYETTYLWLISHLNPSNDKSHIFTIIIPHFGSDSNFNKKGWYLAIYDNINNKYSLPLSMIHKMTNNKVEIIVDPIFVDNINDFNYTTAVMIRINDTFLDKQPDYLVDSSPDDDMLWSKWFT